MRQKLTISTGDGIGIKGMKNKGVGELLEQPTVIIHTGNWGTGAFGGHKVLMALVQLIAAHQARVDKIIFHTYAPDGTEALEKAKVSSIETQVSSLVYQKR